MQKICVTYQYIKQAQDSQAFHTLTYWVQLKSNFTKPIFYNTSSRYIGGLLNINNATANKHVNRMIELGWAEIIDGHLRLSSLKNFKKESIIRVPVFKGKTDQLATLRGIKINRNLLKQDHEVKFKTEIVIKAHSVNQKLSKSELTMIRKAGGVKKFEMSITDRTTLSNKRIGSLLDVSKRTASRLQVRLNKLGLIKSEACYERINVVDEVPKNGFLYKGMYYVIRIANTVSPILPPKKVCGNATVIVDKK